MLPMRRRVRVLLYRATRFMYTCGLAVMAWLMGRGRLITASRLRAEALRDASGENEPGQPLYVDGRIVGYLGPPLDLEAMERADNLDDFADLLEANPRRSIFSLMRQKVRELDEEHAADCHTQALPRGSDPA